MLQRENQPSANSPYPRRGMRLPDLAFDDLFGRPVQLSDYRARRNLALILAGDSESAAHLPLLADLARRYPEFAGQETQVLVVVAASREQAQSMASQLPFPVLLDPDSRAHRALAGSDADGRVATAVYVTDRYGEVFAAFRSAEGLPLPDAGEILKWLEFVNIQCEECFPPEWPPV